MTDFFEIDLLDVETAKSGDAITVRYSVNGQVYVHVVDGGYVDTGDKVIEHLEKHYGTTSVDHVVLTHPDQDHANGLRAVLENCKVGRLWMNRPWLYAGELIHRFQTYNSVPALERRLREAYSASATLEEIAQRRNIPISAPFQGAAIGAFQVLAPTRNRYLDLIVDSEKTPEVATESYALDAIGELFGKAIRAAANLVKAAWGDEYFPPSGTSAENEMSVIQYGLFNGKRVLLTGDAGRYALNEAADYAPMVGLTLPGIWTFQVPHHGGRHNVDTAVLDRWLGQRHEVRPESPKWLAICSSALADEDHPKKSVERAMVHRGGKFCATEGSGLRVSLNLERPGWVPRADRPYPETQEE